MMGNLLYLVEFLSINLNKNEILKKGINEEIREEVIEKLKDMRNIINIIKDNLLMDIDRDYKEEMNESNENSIKIYSEKQLQNYLEDLEIKSNNIIEDIKNKIFEIKPKCFNSFFYCHKKIFIKIFKYSR